MRNSLRVAALLAALVGRASVARAQDDVLPPVVTTHVDPPYPEGAAGPPHHADVVLTVTVDVTGNVIAAEVVSSAGPEMDEAALAAIRQWKFTPALRGDRPVASKIRVPIHFAPPTPPSPAPLSSEPTAAGAAGAGAAAGASHASSATEPPPAPPTPTSEDEAEEVTVTARATPPSRGASDFNLRVGELARVPRKDAAEILKLAPGILLTNEGGEGHPHQIFLRGFDAREGQDLELSASGVPINEPGNLHGSGYADTHFILPELVTSLRVLEGPFDPRQGNFAVAGSADYELGLPRRGLTARYMRGSFATERLLLLWGPANMDAHTFAGAELYRTAGFGQNRAARRASTMGQYEGKLGERGSFRVTAQAYAADWKAAGLLRDDDWRSGRKGFYDTYDAAQGGQSTRFSAAFDLESRLGKTTVHQQIFVIARGMRSLENFTGFLLDVQQPGQQLHPQRGDLIDRDVSTTTVGGRGWARSRTTVFALPQEVELGYYARYDATDGTQMRLQSPGGAPYRRDVDLGAKLADVGLYADAGLHPLKWVTLRGGVRADLFTFDVLNRCAVKSVRRPSPSDPPGDASCLSQQDFGRYREPTQRQSSASAAVLPRASALFGPFHGATLSASYGQGIRSIDPAYVYQDVRTPFASIAAYEAGASYATQLGSTEVSARSAVFVTHVDRDLVFNETEGRNTLANGTTRSGWMGAARLSGPWFDEAANVTLVRSTFDDTKLLVPYVPNVVVRSDSAVFTELPFRLLGERVRAALSAGVTLVGRRALPYGARSGVIFTIDSSATLTCGPAEIGIMSTNLLDRRYRLGEYNFTSDWQTSTQPTLVPVRHFAAGAPRAVFATFALTWEGT